MITPPPELVEQWQASLDCPDNSFAQAKYIAAQSAQWGADQELEACCQWFICDWTDIETADKLHAARRPKPPSLKEQALGALNRFSTNYQMQSAQNRHDFDLFRRALEALPND